MNPGFQSVFIKNTELFVSGLQGDRIRQFHLFPQAETLEADLRDWIQTQFQPGLAEIKIVGNRSLVAEGIRVLSTLGYKNLSPSVREDQLTELQYYPLSGRVRARIADKKITEKKVEKAIKKIKVLIVDDSPTIQKLLSSILSQDPEINVVATTGRPSEVDALIQKHKPDVITLDINMPEMKGTELLKIIAPKYKIPTLMISSLNREESPDVLQSLENGAIDYIHKPAFHEIDMATPLIIEKVKVAALSKPKARVHLRSIPQGLKEALQEDTLIAIGSSTGGTEALKEILIRLPKEIPPIVIVQHIPAIFSTAFAKRLNDLCPFEVKEAEDGDEIRPGRVLIAPGGLQMSIVKKSIGHKIKIDDSAPVNRHKPSVDVLFDTVAKEFKEKAIGIVLTGMGSDGAKGLLEMKKSGARTIAQNEESCVVFGMPKEAIKIGAAQEISDLFEIPQILARWLSCGKTKQKKTH